MKLLTLIRHAKSSWDNANLSDFERTLNDRGRRDAEFMSKMLPKLLPNPDVIYCSKAERAMETSHYFIESYNFPTEKVIYDYGIYENGIRYLIKLIQQLPDSANNVIIIGHNPDITAFCNAYTSTYFDNVPTCGIIGIDFDTDKWSDFSNTIGKIRFYEYPKKYLK